MARAPHLVLSRNLDPGVKSGCPFYLGRRVGHW